MNMAEKLKRAISLCIDGHANHARGQKTRSWDRKTPYSVHSIWCAMTFLQETKLSKDAKSKRVECAFVLLFHDFYEDTTSYLPAWLSNDSVELINQMTFSGMAGSTEIEMKEIWSRQPILRLLKLYDKVSNLLDGSWMSDEKWNGQYVPYVLRLTDDVEDVYGDLNIVRIARAVAIPRSSS